MLTPLTRSVVKTGCVYVTTVSILTVYSIVTTQVSDDNYSQSSQSVDAIPEVCNIRHVMGCGLLKMRKK